MRNSVFCILSILMMVSYAFNALDRVSRNRSVRSHRINFFYGSGSNIWFEYNYEFYNDHRSSFQANKDVFIHIYNTNKESLTIMRNGENESINVSFELENIEGDLKFGNLVYDINTTKYILPITTSKYSLVYKPEKLALTKDIFIITFNGTLWLLFACTLITCVLFFRICTKYYHILYKDHALWSWVDITFWVIAASCQQGVSYSPHKFASCLIFLSVYVLAYLLYTVFTATITSTLLQETSNRFVTEVTNLNFISLKFINDLDEVEHYTHSEKVATLKDMLVLLEDEYTIGMVPKVLLYKHFSQASDEHTLYKTMDLPHRYVKASFVLKANNETTFTKERIATLLQSGLLKRNLSGLYSNNFCTTESRYYKASFKHIRSAILLFSGGMGISLLILIAELILAYCKQSQ